MSEESCTRAACCCDDDDDVAATTSIPTIIIVQFKNVDRKNASILVVVVLVSKSSLSLSLSLSSSLVIYYSPLLSAVAIVLRCFHARARKSRFGGGFPVFSCSLQQQQQQQQQHE